MNQRSIEIKVGILILISLVMLGGFVVVMGGLSFEPTYTINVDFHNPGGLKTGAPVRIAGVKVGRVSAIELRTAELTQVHKTREPLIRVVASLESRYKDSIYENSRWFVTTQGVLGELFLAVDPGTADRPALKDGAVVRGVSPPRLDLLLSEAYELLHRAYVGVTENEEKIAETFDGLHRTLNGTGRFFDDKGKKLDQLVDDVDKLVAETNDTVLAARERYVDNPQMQRILDNVEGASSTMNDNLPPLLNDSRQAVQDLSRLTNTMASKEQVERYAQITRDLSDAATRAKGVAQDAEVVVQHIKSGRGTVGALVMDEAIYDDVQELLRDLKHNPWKFFWRE